MTLCTQYARPVDHHIDGGGTHNTAPLPEGVKATGLGFDGSTTHYGAADDPYEAIKVIRAWGLGFELGNVVKYICRAGRGNGNNQRTTEQQQSDLTKARAYLDEYISGLNGL